MSRTPRSAVRRTLAFVAGATILAAGASACADAAAPTGGPAAPSATPPAVDAAAPSPAAPGPTPAHLTGHLVVLAASSLEPVLAPLSAELEAAHPDLKVDLSFAASSALAEQIAAGAPADLLLTASSATMAKAGPDVTDPAVLAGNTLVIVTPPDNPGRITTLADLENRDLRLALCAVEVPCGAAAARVVADAGLTLTPDTYAPNATAALTLARTGEVDAALVYTTDAKDAGSDVATVVIPEAADVVNDYLVATAAEAPNPAAAAAFRALLTSDRGSAALADAGFLLP
ncbi:molybdate ABC transporter substrate-binding protein [Sanguibacter sp. A247]|uniref:molybdate ABC transporter substrate-binding protein n=1 Tax=unclassified Sanguibacter TaxID=2645534 RepID=UPI003FD89F47